MLNRPLGGLNVKIKPDHVVSTGKPEPIWGFPKISDLEMRAFKRLFGIPSPSLIHNGKKRRKS